MYWMQASWLLLLGGVYLSNKLVKWLWPVDAKKD